MKPRYKVIAEYPQGFSTIGNFSNPIKTGDILMNILPQQNIVWRKMENGEPTVHTVHNPELYAANFRKMEWWEDRKPEEMPEYVRPTEDAVMEGYSYPVKIAGYHKVYPEWFYCEEYPGATMTLENFLPATEQQYINSKPQP